MENIYGAAYISRAVAFSVMSFVTVHCRSIDSANPDCEGTASGNIFPTMWCVPDDYDNHHVDTSTNV